MLDVGIIGVDQEWERYRPLLTKLRRPLRVTAVYDSVLARAERAAERLKASVVTGIQALSRRADVQAVLLFNANWMGTQLLQLVVTAGKPLFVHPWFFTQTGQYADLAETAEHEGVVAMPSMWRRYTPAVMRLRELIATELGSVQSLTMRASVNSRHSTKKVMEKLIGWLDVSNLLFKSQPDQVAIRSLNSESESTGNQLTASYGCSAESNLIVNMDADLGSSSKEHRELRALISNDNGLLSQGPTKTAFNFEPDSFEPILIGCECGAVHVESRNRVAWTTDPTASHAFQAASGRGDFTRSYDNESWCREFLSAERSEHEVMLDLFCRRVYGGLIPVADFKDLAHCSNHIHQAASRTTC